MNIIKIIGTVLAVVLPAIGHAGIIPGVPAEAFTALAAAIFGWLHLPQPGTVAATKEPAE